MRPVMKPVGVGVESLDDKRERRFGVVVEV